LFATPVNRGTLMEMGGSSWLSDLSQSDWNEFLDVIGSGTTEEKANYNCWMERHLSQCERCPACPGRDPFAD